MFMNFNCYHPCCVQMLLSCCGSWTTPRSRSRPTYFRRMTMLSSTRSAGLWSRHSGAQSSIAVGLSLSICHYFSQFIWRNCHAILKSLYCLVWSFLGCHFFVLWFQIFSFSVFRGHVGDVYDICWTRDGNFMVSGAVDNTAIMWDINKGLPGRFSQCVSL